VKRFVLLTVLCLLCALILSCGSKQDPSKSNATTNKISTEEVKETDKVYAPECQPYSEHKFSEWEEVIPPIGCRITSIRSHCTVCGIEREWSVNRTEHTFGEWKTITEPTCTASGKMERVCSVCSEVEKEDIAILAHIPDKWTVKVSPSCVAGTETATCTLCKNTIERSVPATDEHIMIPFVSNVTGTYTLGSPSKVTYDCANCIRSISKDGICAEINDSTDIIVEAEKGVFTVGTVMESYLLKDPSDQYNVVKNELAKISSLSGYKYHFRAYDVDFVNNGASVSPNGNVTLYLPRRSSKSNAMITKENLAVYFIDRNGKLSEIAYTYSNRIIVEGKSGVYVVLDKDPELNDWTVITNYKYRGIFKLQTLDTGTGGPLGMGAFHVQSFTSKDRLPINGEKNYDLTVTNQYYPESMQSVLSKYDDEFFRNNVLLLVCDYIAKPSLLNIDSIRVLGDRLEIVTEKQILVDEKTDSYYFYGFVVEMPRSEIANVEKMVILEP